MLAPGEEDYGVQLQEAEKATASLGVTLVVIEVRAVDYERAFASMVAGHATARTVMSSTQLNRDRARIIALAAKHRMPAISRWREQVEEGGLMAHGSSVSGLSRRMGQLRRSDSQGDEPGRAPGRATLYLRARHQPEDREGPRPDDSIPSPAVRG